MPSLNPGIPALPTQPGLSIKSDSSAAKWPVPGLDTYAAWNATDKLLIVGELDTVLNRAFDNGPAYSRDGRGGVSAVSVHTKVLAGNTICGAEGQRRHLQWDLTDAEGHHLTATYQIAEGVQTKWEYRRDFSNMPFFLTNTPASSRRSRTPRCWGSSGGSAAKKAVGSGLPRALTSPAKNRHEKRAGEGDEHFAPDLSNGTEAVGRTTIRFFDSQSALVWDELSSQRDLSLVPVRDLGTEQFAREIAALQSIYTGKSSPYVFLHVSAAENDICGTVVWAVRRADEWTLIHAATSSPVADTIVEIALALPVKAVCFIWEPQRLSLAKHYLLRCIGKRTAIPLDAMWLLRRESNGKELPRVLIRCGAQSSRGRIRSGSGERLL